MRKTFSFIYPVTQPRVDLERKGGWRYDHVTDLIVRGMGYQKSSDSAEPIEDRYDFDIEEVLFEGKNVLPLLETFESLSNIEEACFHHIHHLFSSQPSDYQHADAISMNAVSAKVITLHLRRKIK